MPSALSLGFLPFFLLPFSFPSSPAEPVGMTIGDPSFSRPVSAAPRHRVRGHVAEPSGCEAEWTPSFASDTIGAPNRGRLVRGKFLPESDVIRHVDAHDCNFWGTDELTSMVDRVARRVAADHPGARLTVGELSKREGGDIYGHGSHENGRDVDFGFYFTDENGLPYETRRMLNVRADKTARAADGTTLRFDVARNWKVVEALLEDESDLNIAIVHRRVRRWLLDHARRTGVSDELRRRASIVLRIPNRGTHPHLNHFHVRIYCPESAIECRDFNATWDWVDEARAERAGESRGELFATNR
jgi:penicillin-insensitive murein endopeptidase